MLITFLRCSLNNLLFTKMFFNEYEQTAKWRHASKSLSICWRSCYLRNFFIHTIQPTVQSYQHKVDCCWVKFDDKTSSCCPTLCFCFSFRLPPSQDEKWYVLDFVVLFPSFATSGTTKQWLQRHQVLEAQCDWMMLHPFKNPRKKYFGLTFLLQCHRECVEGIGPINETPGPAGSGKFKVKFYPRSYKCLTLFPVHTTDSHQNPLFGKEAEESVIKKLTFGVWLPFVDRSLRCWFSWTSDRWAWCLDHKHFIVCRGDIFSICDGVVRYPVSQDHFA